MDGAIIQSDSSFMQQINSSFVKGCEFTNHGRNYYALWIDDEALAGMHISRPVTQESFTVYVDARCKLRDTKNNCSGG